MALTVEITPRALGSWVDVTAYCPFLGDAELGLQALEVEYARESRVGVARLGLMYPWGFQAMEQMYLLAFRACRGQACK